MRALGRSNGAANLGVAVFVVLAGLFVLATKQLPTLSQNDSESYLAPFLLLLVCARQAAPRWPEAARWLNRAAGQRFRDELLSRGNSRDPLESFRAFRGRDAEIGPLLRRRGLE
mgnify:CR=1 FL=1